MALRLDGKACAATIRQELALEVTRLRERGVEPRLVVLRVGDDPASETYVRNKRKAAESVGIRGEELHLPATSSEAEVAAAIGRLGADPSVHGLMLQLPLPAQMAAERLLPLIPVAKDVDGTHPTSLGLLLAGWSGGFQPCTPRGILELLRRNGIAVAGKRAVVLGRSNIVGKPLAALLTAAHATVTVCHTRTADLRAEVERAELLVVAIGRPGFVPGAWVREGAVVVDTGTTVVDGRLLGDVDFASAEPRASAITPVPGGVGPMTIAMLLAQTVEAAQRVAG